jgi:hypothetical protein
MDEPDVEHEVPLPTIEGFPIIDGTGAGTATIGLIPALPISTEPSGIPALTAPLADGANVVVDGVAPLEAVPHIPDIGVVPTKDGPSPMVIPPPS